MENRTWRPTCPLPALIAIHAGAIVTWDALDEYANLLPPVLPTSVVLGMVTVTGVVRDADSPWADPGQYHWLLDSAVELDQPVRFRGWRGLWEWRPG